MKYIPETQEDADDRGRDPVSEIRSEKDAESIMEEPEELIDTPDHITLTRLGIIEALQ